MTGSIHLPDALHAVADGSRLGRSIAWNFIKANWLQIRVTGDLKYEVDRYISPVVEKFSSTFQYNDVYKFLTSKFPAGKLPESVQSLLRKIKRNVKWLKREAVNVEFWLDNHKG